jgi:dinuclear metal center YbgI/SA1388 family protein
MPTVQDVLEAIQTLAPSRHALSFDKVGLQVGTPYGEVRSGVVSLDWSMGALEFARTKKAGLIVCHHPLIWEPLSALTDDTRSARMAAELIRSDVSFIACHTNWDAAWGGVTDALADRLALSDLEPFGSAAEVPSFKLVTFAPKDDANRLIDALSAAGAGVIGLYERCAFYNYGTGTFRGLEGSNPSIGSPGRIEEVPEARIELVVAESAVDAVVRALRAAHPYEEPAYDLYPRRTTRELPLGRVGSLPQELSLRDLASYVDERLFCRCWTWGDPSKVIRRLAVAGGAADGEGASAMESGADALLTGEIRQHIGVEIAESGFAGIAAGHYATEQPGCEALKNSLSALVPEVAWHLFEPKSGFSGRPF